MVGDDIVKRQVSMVDCTNPDMILLKNTHKTAITDFMKEGTFCPSRQVLVESFSR